MSGFFTEYTFLNAKAFYIGENRTCILFYLLQWRLCLVQCASDLNKDVSYVVECCLGWWGVYRSEVMHREPLLAAPEQIHQT